jgi:hypothetical protein
VKYLAFLDEASNLPFSGAKTTHNTGVETYEQVFPEKVAFRTPDQVTKRMERWIQRGVLDLGSRFASGECQRR